MGILLTEVVDVGTVEDVAIWHLDLLARTSTFDSCVACLDHNVATFTVRKVASRLVIVVLLRVEEAP